MLKCMGGIMVWIMVREIGTTTKVFQDKTENEKRKRRREDEEKIPPARLLASGYALPLSGSLS